MAQISWGEPLAGLTSARVFARSRSTALSARGADVWPFSPATSASNLAIFAFASRCFISDRFRAVAMPLALCSSLPLGSKLFFSFGL